MSSNDGLLEEFRAAEDSDARRNVLGRRSLAWDMEEAQLPALWEIDSDPVRDYVDDQIARMRMWEEAPSLTTFRDHIADQEPEYALELFRKTAGPDEWTERVAELSSNHEGDTLIEKLEESHPLHHEVYTSFSGFDVFELLYDEHEDDVWPYIENHLREPWSVDGWDDFIDRLADDEEWTKWEQVVSGQPSRNLDTYVNWVLDQVDRSDGWKRRRLHGLAGASYFEWSGRKTARLDVDSACRVYAYAPELLRTILDEHVRTPDYVHDDHGYRRLAKMLLKTGDEEYFDRLAAKYLSMAFDLWYGGGDQIASVFAHFVDHYEAIEDDAEFARRANRVLLSFQPDDDERWKMTRKNNPLDEIFFEQPDRLAAEPEFAIDLLESSYSPIRSLGYRTLRATGEKCGRIASKNAHLVLGAPLDRLDRAGMRAAVDVMESMVQHDEHLAKIVVERLRTSASLTYPSFSKGELVNAIGRILNQSPSLRRPSEKPVIYEHSTR